MFLIRLFRDPVNMLKVMRAIVRILFFSKQTPILWKTDRWCVPMYNRVTGTWNDVRTTKTYLDKSQTRTSVAVHGRTASHCNGILRVFQTPERCTGAGSSATRKNPWGWGSKIIIQKNVIINNHVNNNFYFFLC